VACLGKTATCAAFAVHQVMLCSGMSVATHTMVCMAV